MSQIKTSLIIDLAGNLANRAQQFTHSLTRMGRDGSRSMQALSRTMQAMGHGLDSLGNRYTALLTGAAGLGAVKQVGDLSQRFTRLGIQANADTEEMDKLKREIFAVAQAPDIRVDPGEITGAIEEIIEKTGDLKFARENLRTFGMAISATGAQGKDIGGIMAEFQKMGIIDPKEVLEALDVLNVQGKEGAFTLQNLAALGPRVVTAYTSMGRGGVQAIREMGAALQVIRMGTGSSEMAATAFEAVMRTFSDRKKIETLQGAGIQIFDVEALKKGKEVLRPVNEVMVDIIRKAKGKKSVLSDVFDAEAIRAFNTAVDEFNRTGAINSLDRFMNVQADGTATMEDSARAAKEFNAAMTSLKTSWQQFADSNLTKPVRDLADALNSVPPDTVQRWLKIGAAVAGTVGVLVVARKVWNMGKWVGGILGGGKAGAPGAGNLGGFGGPGGPVPVYVVNKHLSMLPGQGWGFPGGKEAGGKVLETGGKILRSGAVAALGKASLAGAAGYGVGTLINKYAIEGTRAEDVIGYALNKIAAMLGNKEAKLAIEINSGDGATARVKQLKSKGMSLDVNSGLMMMASH